MKRFWIVFCSLIFLSPLLPAEPLRILTTFAPIDSLTRNVVGDAAKVDMLLPAGATPHGYAISPGDLKKIAQADVIVMNGLGAEEWLSTAFAQGGESSRLVIDSSEGIEPITGVTPIKMKKEEHDHDHHADHHHHGHDHGDANPHVWLDPVLAMKQVKNIQDALIKRDPDNADQYRENSEAYLQELEALNQEIQAVTDSLSNRNLITFHDAFVYFAKRYGFDLIGVIQTFPGREPSPKYLQQLRNAIQENDVRVLFTEPQFQPRILESLADDLDLPIATLDTLEAGEPSPSFYITAMKKNLATLKSSLDGESGPRD